MNDSGRSQASCAEDDEDDDNYRKSRKSSSKNDSDSIASKMEFACESDSENTRSVSRISRRTQTPSRSVCTTNSRSRSRSRSISKPRSERTLRSQRGVMHKRTKSQSTTSVNKLSRSASQKSMETKDSKASRVSKTSKASKGSKGSKASTRKGSTLEDIHRRTSLTPKTCKGCGKEKKNIPEPAGPENGDDFDAVQRERKKRQVQCLDPELVARIEAEILDESFCPKLRLDDIVGLGLAKEVIKEVVIYPLKRPELFTGLRRPPKGILLFGPPGTGKTLIGRCIATETDSTFFNISSSTLTSKWMGESEKLVKALFVVAKSREPAVIFVDEIDALLSQRSVQETGSSRRMKNEFLINMDGACTTDDDKVIIIGATNRPQELDEAARRRFVKRLYIPLPDEKGRRELVVKMLESENHSLTEEDMTCIAKNTRGYSGADIKNVCHEAAMGPIRSIPLQELHNVPPHTVRPISVFDFRRALARIKPSVSKNDLVTYETWDREYGCSCTT